MCFVVENEKKRKGRRSYGKERGRKFENENFVDKLSQQWLTMCINCTTLVKFTLVQNCGGWICYIIISNKCYKTTILMNLDGGKFWNLGKCEMTKLPSCVN